MRWFKRVRRPQPPAPPPPPEPRDDVPLPLLVHAHPKSAWPPGPLEDGLVELEREEVVLHAVAGIVRSDGTIQDLPAEKLEWARRLTYRHLKREGCLAEFGVPLIAAYEAEDGKEMTNVECPITKE
jgi:hypothetical protein